VVSKRVRGEGWEERDRDVRDAMVTDVKDDEVRGRLREGRGKCGRRGGSD